MSPRDFSAEVLVVRLDLMRDLLDDLDAVGVLTVERLQNDRIARRATERILTQLVDLAADINTHAATSLGGLRPTEYRQSFDDAARAGLIRQDLADALKASVGMRNVLIHEYVATDLEMVAAAVPLARRNYAAYVRSVATWLQARG
ncbi:hypothetical protein GCM10022199_00040 [Marihabitans asiaticum]|uniref:Uncharacterized protein YutE (UPF0331/DUF86 family) n=1 Tax=Marihabitans asiaticum TaxID=415218 RepID=A0A560WGA1_9MICO|nr:uncharacterized protein YutE (UPF0331/DUF86 family) [Marihabitans asiaticum]